MLNVYRTEKNGRHLRHALKKTYYFQSVMAHALERLFMFRETQLPAKGEQRAIGMLPPGRCRPRKETAERSQPTSPSEHVGAIDVALCAAEQA